MKSLLILDAFITEETEEKLLNSFINSIKSIGDDVLLMSNTKISKETQENVNYFFYDKRNQLFVEDYNFNQVVIYYTNNGGFTVSNIFPHPQPHGLSVLINLFRGVKLAKDLGYTHFYKMEYDGILGEETKVKIKEMNESCVLNNKKGVFFIGNDEKSGDRVEPHYFFCEIDFFINNFWNISCEQDYIDYLTHENNNRDFITMEYFIHENLIKSKIDEIYIYEGMHKLFSDSHLNSKHTKVYYDEKYKECFTKFYIIRDNPDNIAIYSVNKKNIPDFRKIIVLYNDGTQDEIHQYFTGYDMWAYNVVKNDIKKMMVYDSNNVFLFEEYFENILNEIVFN